MATFIENLRESMKTPFLYPFFNKRPSRDAKLPSTKENIREMFRQDAERELEDNRQKGRSALNGTLFENTDPFNNPRFMTRDDRYDYVTDEVLENYDAISDMLDKYDSASNIDEKLDVINKTWNQLGVSSWKHPEWFLAFTDWTKQVNDTSKDFKSLSNEMRRILKFSKDNRYKLV